MSIAFSMHNDILTVVVKNKVYNIGKDDERYNRVKDALKNNDEEALVRSLDVSQNFQNYITNKTCGKVQLVGDKVFMDGKELNNVIVERIRDFAKNGLPFEHLLKFIENIAKNPSYRAQEELFKFLENKYLPVTEDGCFYAYKSIRNDWKDVYSGTIDNSIGNTISMDRSSVDDNREMHCSKGLHCGAIEYVNNYGGSDKRIIIVKVNPADVVSVPSDYNCQKMRVCKYICWAEYEKPLDKPLYSDNIAYVDNYYSQSDDWDEWDDLDDDEEWCEEDDYDDDEEDDDFDYVTDKDVCVTHSSCCQHLSPKYNSTYHNKRDSKGRFTRK